MKDQRLYDRLVSRIAIDPKTGCWNWTGPSWKNRPYPSNRYGYLTVLKPGKPRGTALACHRAMMLALHGPLTPQQCVCHRCDNVLCINPNHLWIGTMKENIRDSRAKLRHYESRRDYCERGHPLFGDNMRLSKQADGTGTRRTCKKCEIGRMRVKAGWPEHLAYTAPKVPAGYKMDFETGKFVFLLRPRRKRTSVSASTEHG